AEVRIRDNGDGMSEAVKQRVFEPFFTTKPAGVGTGLGLSMSYDIIVHQHDGEIRVESEPGQYAEFIVTLPKDAARKE
ncbi:MAG TPA: ATP-binding protein, partial [Candidatus Aquilonibacter sp.]